MITMRFACLQSHVHACHPVTVMWKGEGRVWSGKSGRRGREAGKRCGGMPELVLLVVSQTNTMSKTVCFSACLLKDSSFPSVRMRFWAASQGAEGCQGRREEWEQKGGRTRLNTPCNAAGCCLA